MEKKVSVKKVSIYKKKIVNELTSRISKSKNVFVTNFSGLKNKEIESLRDALRGVSSEYLVVKNSLTKQALKDTKLVELTQFVDGAIGITFGASDSVSESKALVGFAKNHEAFKIRGAYLEGRLFSLLEIQQLAMLPSREVLLAQTVYAIKSPINQLVFVLKENLRKLVGVMDGISKKSK